MPLDETSLKKVNKLWGERAKEISQKDITAKKYWQAHPIITKCINKAITGDKEINIFKFIKNKFKKSFDNALFLGSGSGSLERTMIQDNIVKHCVAYDISQEAVNISIQKAKELGIDHLIDYKVEDINTIKLPPNAYDIIFGWHSLHHLEKLEEVLEEISNALKDDGVFIVNEYVGPSRYQFSDKQIKLMNWLLDCLPDNYKTSFSDGKIRGHTYRENPEVIIKSDPTESIRSDEILEVLGQNFEKIFQRDYGGTLLQFALDDIVGNFDPNNLKDAVFLEFIYSVEKLLIEEKVITSDFIFGIYKKRKNLT